MLMLLCCHHVDLCGNGYHRFELCDGAVVRRECQTKPDKVRWLGCKDDR
jgi:hypothetical protein